MQKRIITFSNRTTKNTSLASTCCHTELVEVLPSIALPPFITVILFAGYAKLKHLAHCLAKPRSSVVDRKINKKGVGKELSQHTSIESKDRYLTCLLDLIKSVD